MQFNDSWLKGCSRPHSNKGNKRINHITTFFKGEKMSALHMFTMVLWYCIPRLRKLCCFGDRFWYIQSGFLCKVLERGPSVFVCTLHCWRWLALRLVRCHGEMGSGCENPLSWSFEAWLRNTRRTGKCERADDLPNGKLLAQGIDMDVWFSATFHVSKLKGPNVLLLFQTQYQMGETLVLDT